MIDMESVIHEVDVYVVLHRIAVLRRKMAEYQARVAIYQCIHDNLVQRAQCLGALLRVRPDLEA